MRGREHAVFIAVDQFALLLGMTAPEQKHQPLTLTIQMFDGLVGKLLPTLLLVGGSLAGFHGKHRIEQQHALLCPMGQVAMGRYLDSQIPMDFLVDIDQRRRGFDTGIRDTKRTAARPAVEHIAVITVASRPIAPKIVA